MSCEPRLGAASAMLDASSRADMDRLLQALAPQEEPGEPLQKIVDGMPAEVSIVDADWCIVTANAAWTAFARQRSQGEMLLAGKSFLQFWEWRHRCGAPEAAALIAGMRAIHNGESRQFLRTYRSSYDQQYYHLSIGRFEAEGVPYAIISRLNVTELFALRRERLRLHARLKQVQTNLMRAQQDERKRVGRELHDTAAQYLVAMNLAVARLREMDGDTPVAGVANDLGDLLDHLHCDLRGLTFLLHPPQIEQIGLHAASDSLCRGFARRTGLDVHLAIHGCDRRLGSPVEAAAYRIIQESLSNIQRHARASRVRVRINDRTDVVHVVIIDDGIGLPDGPDTTQQELSRRGVGIAGMIARTSEIGGRIAVKHRTRASGTVVAAALPRRETGPPMLADSVDALACSAFPSLS